MVKTEPVLPVSLSSCSDEGVNALPSSSLGSPKKRLKSDKAKGEWKGRRRKEGPHTKKGTSYLGIRQIKTFLNCRKIKKCFDYSLRADLRKSRNERETKLNFVNLSFSRL